MNSLFNLLRVGAVHGSRYLKYKDRQISELQEHCDSNVPPDQRAEFQAQIPKRASDATWKKLEYDSGFTAAQEIVVKKDFRTAVEGTVVGLAVAVTALLIISVIGIVVLVLLVRIFLS